MCLYLSLNERAVGSGSFMILWECLEPQIHADFRGFFFSPQITRIILV